MRKKDRQIRLEAKKKFMEEKEIDKENIEIIETDKKYIESEKDFVVLDKTGRTKTYACMKTFVDVTTKPANKRKYNSFDDAGPSRVTSEALRLRSKKLGDTSKRLQSL